MKGLSRMIANVSFDAFLNVCLMESIFTDYLKLCAFPPASAKIYREALEVFLDTARENGIDSYIIPLLFTFILFEIPNLQAQHQIRAVPGTLQIIRWLRDIFETPSLAHIFLSKQETQTFVRTIVLDLHYHVPNPEDMHIYWNLVNLLEKEIDEFRCATWAKRRMAFAPLKEELMSVAWHPRRVAAWLEAGMRFEDFDV